MSEKQRLLYAASPPVTPPRNSFPSTSSSREGDMGQGSPGLGDLDHHVDGRSSPAPRAVRPGAKAEYLSIPATMSLGSITQ